MIQTLHNSDHMKKINNYIKGSLFILLMSANGAFAQTADAGTKEDIVRIPKMFFDPVTYIWLLIGFILLVTIYTLSKTVNQLTKTIEGQHGRSPEEIQAAVREAKSNTSWAKLMKVLTRSVPVEQEKDVMLDHNYDGIRELDNKLPPWWVWGFYVTIFFAVGYVIYYHISGTGPLQAKEYQIAMDQAAAEKKAFLEKTGGMISAESVTLLTDASAIDAGKTTFMSYCKTCHGDFGQGNVGPNLTDEFWIHGGGIKNVFNTITEGVPAKGMISWKAQLSPKAIQEVASYVLSLQGTKPAGAKDPQGEKWVDPSAAPADSTAAIDTTAAATVTAKK